MNTLLERCKAPKPRQTKKVDLVKKSREKSECIPSNWFLPSALLPRKEEHLCRSSGQEPGSAEAAFLPSRSLQNLLLSCDPFPTWSDCKDLTSQLALVQLQETALFSGKESFQDTSPPSPLISTVASSQRRLSTQVLRTYRDSQLGKNPLVFGDIFSFRSFSC